MHNTFGEVFPIIAPGLVPPGLMGLIIWFKYRPSNFARMAALLTLKPLLATPVWLLILQWYQANYSACDVSLPYLLTAVPGLALTGLIIFGSRQTLWQHRRAIPSYVLLGLDTGRWVYTVWLWSSCRGLGITLELVGVGLALPTLFAIVAWVLVHFLSPDTPEATF